MTLGIDGHTAADSDPPLPTRITFPNSGKYLVDLPDGRHEVIDVVAGDFIEFEPGAKIMVQVSQLDLIANSGEKRNDTAHARHRWAHSSE